MYAYIIILIISFIYGFAAQISPTGYNNFNETIKTYTIDCPYGSKEIFNESTKIVCGGLNPLKFNGSHEKGYIDLNITLSY